MPYIAQQEYRFGGRRYPKGAEIPDDVAAKYKPWGYEAEEVSASQAARDLASEHGIDLSQVEGTGKDGSITKGDVEKLVSAE